MESLDKARRQQTIAVLLGEEEIGSQEQLTRALARRGHEVTQATVSRDLRELGVIRMPITGGYRYLPPEELEPATAPAPTGVRLSSLAGIEVLSVAANETVVVVRTLTARAQGVAVYLDQLRLPEVLGTIGGDDTILIVPRSVHETTALRDRLAELFGVD